ncbi:MAG: YebC/PmpR family DNA-binding transcriptional regulator [Phycisphaerae bacterium]|nr:YebC/PmpR family DNA-binding transcriptional regulator [Phycisphaerae bacterium]
MAGHSRWKNIKHRKAASDAKRGKAWSKCVKAIIVAAKNGGQDPSANLSLRYAIDEARYENVPRDTIERAIKKGGGELGDDHYEPVRYEAYGPGGAAIVIDALTNNRTRTAADVRLILSKFGGNLGTTGCVSHCFEARGLLTIPAGTASEDQLLELAAGAGADDVATEDDAWVISTAPASLHVVRTALEASAIKVESARIELVPTVTVSTSGEQAQGLLKLLESLEDNDDVQRVYANFDIAESELDALGA